MKYLSLGVVLLVSAVGIAAQTPAGKSDDKVMKEPITLTGCVEAGKAPDTFILTNVVKGDSTMPAPAETPQPTAAANPPGANPPAAPPFSNPTLAKPGEPAPTGTSGEPAAIYWLDPPEKLKAHVGHKISVTGTLDEDVDKAKIKEKDDKVKIEAERGTRKVEAKEGTQAAADAKAAKTGDKQPSYKVKVKSITMISTSCS